MYDPILIQATVTIVTAGIQAHVEKSDDQTLHVRSFIRATYETLAACGQPKEPEALPRPEPAVPIKKSVSPEALTCLDCGKKFKSLRRHIGGAHGLKPDDYRSRWELPRDYPMTAPAYSERRSQLAKDMGLGRKTDESAA